MNPFNLDEIKKKLIPLNESVLRKKSFNLGL